MAHDASDFTEHITCLRCREAGLDEWSILDCPDIRNVCVDEEEPNAPSPNIHAEKPERERSEASSQYDILQDFSQVLSSSSKGQETAVELAARTATEEEMISSPSLTLSVMLNPSFAGKQPNRIHDLNKKPLTTTPRGLAQENDSAALLVSHPTVNWEP
ncbi:hypothetical protein KEM54_001012 [Ascosphaera aggregata]|nr:hypothetical protein KEM54_001012 [Ascosphaera aggregata]